MNKLYGLLLGVLLFSYTAGAQCFRDNRAFSEGEYLSYEISYNWGPIWVDAGIVSFSIDPETYLGKPAWHLKSSGRTYKSYDFFFKVVDYYDAWVDPSTFHSYEFRRSVNEGSFKLINTLRYDRSGQTIYSCTKTNDNPVRYDTIRPAPCTFNPLAAVYFARTLDISGDKNDARIPVNVIIDDSTFSIYIRYIGKEIVENRDGNKFRCIKFAAKMVHGTIFKGDEDVLVWVTDDDNHIPVYVEAKIIVGTVKAYLKESRGVRNPLTSLLPMRK